MMYLIDYSTYQGLLRCSQKECQREQKVFLRECFCVLEN
jgi:hypothetical protein